MSLARFWSKFKLLHFSQPAGDRPLYRAIQGKSISSVLEINAGSGQRSERLIKSLREQGMGDGFRYAVIDSFEMGGEGRLTLKGCHTLLGKLGAKPLPVPHTGNLAVALTRVAHTIGAVDLVVADCGIGEIEQPAVRAVLHKILHADTLLVCKSDASSPFSLLPVGQFVTEPMRRAA
jgi:hypothetical protein